MRMISGFAERFYRAGRFPYGTLGGPVSFDQGKQGGTAYHTSHALHVVVCGIFYVYGHPKEGCQQSWRVPARGELDFYREPRPMKQNAAPV